MKLPVFCLLLLLPTVSLASDGVLEINQTCAVDTGCSAGDTPGFPITISTPGSYLLTSNLSILPTGGQNAIVLSASDVTLDLNGFTITGRAQSGIGISAFGAVNGEVRNGNLQFFGTGLTSQGNDLRLHGLQVLGNGSQGIEFVAGRLRIESCLIKGNDFGIRLGASAEAVILDSIVIENRLGLNFGSGSPPAKVTLDSNVITSNSGADLQTGGIPFVQLGPSQCGTNTTCP